MRIAAITVSFLPRVGGAEFAVHHLARNWANDGHEVLVLNATSGEATHPDANYAVRRYSILRGSWRWGLHRQPFSGWVSRQLAGALREFRPDVISAHFGYPMAIWLSRLDPVPPYLITCHGPALDEEPIGPRKRYGIDPLLSASFAKSGGVVAISSFAKRQLLELGVAAGKIVEISNGVDTRQYGVRVEGFDLRRELGFPGDSQVVLSVGRNTHEKAYDRAIDAFARVAAERPALRYAMIGRGTSAWRSRVLELGLGDRVALHDGLYGAKLIGAYQQADIFMMSSIQELCPLVVPEAMAAGLPELVTNVSGSQDMVVDGTNGFVVEPGDMDALATALARLADDEALRRRMGAASLARSASYDWATLARRYLDVAPRIG